MDNEQEEEAEESVTSIEIELTGGSTDSPQTIVELDNQHAPHSHQQ